jgi:outer membrane immunogenic protein
MKKLLLVTTTLVASVACAQAADLGAPRAPVAAAVVAPAFNWTGFYLGAHVGYGFGRTTGITPGLVAYPANTTGPLIGGQVGFNYQINQIVLGAEADIALAAITGRNPGVGLPAPVLYRTNMLGSLRARGGIAVDRVLLYVTGGLGFQNASFTNTVGPEKYTRTGWTLGAGVEYALTQNWTVKGEYAYYNFGTRALGPTYTGTVRSDVHTVKLGVNYLFSTGPSAVVARY